MRQCAARMQQRASSATDSGLWGLTTHNNSQQATISAILPSPPPLPSPPLSLFPPLFPSPLLPFLFFSFSLTAAKIAERGRESCWQDIWPTQAYVGQVG